MNKYFEAFLAIGFIVALVFTVKACSNYESESGEKVGQVVKISKEGLFCKTWEGELIRGGMNNGSGSFGVKPFHFTINNNDLLNKLKTALDSQHEIKIKYHKILFAPCDSGSSAYFLDNIEFK